MGFLRFVWRHPIGAVITAIGFAITVGGLVSDAYSLAQLGLPSMVWAAIGAAIFMSSVIAMLYRWEARLPVSSNSESLGNAASLVAAFEPWAELEIATVRNDYQPGMEIEVILTAKRRAKDVAVIARFGTSADYLHGSEWLWSTSTRLMEMPNLVAEETARKVFLVRKPLLFNSKDEIVVLGEAITLPTPYAASHGLMVMLEFRAVSEGNEVCVRRLLQFRRHDPLQLMDILDLEAHGWIKDAGTLR